MTRVSASRSFKNCRFSAGPLEEHSRWKVCQSAPWALVSQQTPEMRHKTNLFLTARFWPKFEQSSDYLYEKYKQIKAGKVSTTYLIRKKKGTRFAFPYPDVQWKLNKHSFKCLSCLGYQNNSDPYCIVCLIHSHSAPIPVLTWIDRMLITSKHTKWS